MVTLTPSLSERKRIHSEVYTRHSTWKIRIGIAVTLFVAAICILAADGFLLMKHPTSTFGVFIFISGGICFACIPYIAALSVKNTAKYKCGLPYSSYANGILVLKEEVLEYIFWRVGPHEPAAYSSKRAIYKDEDKFIYRINKQDIISIRLEHDVCFIRGAGEVGFPEWAVEDATVKRFPKEFTFLLAFEQNNASQIIKEWRE